MTIVQDYLGIVIDKSRDNLIPEKGMVMLTKEGFYKKDGEESPQQSFARSATCFSFGDYGLAQRIYDYVSKQHFMFSSPVLSTAVEVPWPSFGKDKFEEAGEWLEENVSPDGFPISCFLPYIPDTREGLLKGRKENATLQMSGGGTAVFMANRSPDEKSTGVMSHLKGYDADTLSYKQSASRRGSIAAYMDVTHPEIMNFLTMKDPASGGDVNKKCFNLHNAVNIPDQFMFDMIQGKKYELVDPKHGPTGDWLEAKEVWETILEMRHKTGEPYLNFIDTVNRNRNPWITKANYHVSQSNLCNEIHLMTSEKRTAVCCLSSLNLEKYEEWKDTTIVEDLIRFLDNILEYFIRLAPSSLKRAVHSASQERAVGLGTLGFHSYLQSKGIPFESGGFNSAVQHTELLYSAIEARAINSSKILAKERGEPEDCLGSGMRNSHLQAIAPNASSADLVKASPGIECFPSNCYISQGRAGSFIEKNRYLEKVLEKYGKNTPEVWRLMNKADGSVQGSEFDFLSDEERACFKTAREIDPLWVIELASIRQKRIDQGQSLNLYKTNNWTKQQMSDVHVAAWAKGCKGLYYMRGESESQKGSQPTVAANNINYEPTDCLGCDG